MKTLGKRALYNFVETAKFEREAGSVVEIDELLPAISVKMHNGNNYFFQGEDAEYILNDVPENLNAEDYILVLAQGW